MRIAAALLMAMMAGSAGAQDMPLAFIAVSGDAQVHAAPDFAEFSPEVITRAETLEGATQKHRERAAKAAKLLDGFQKQGLTVERTSFRLEQSPPGGAKQPVTSYRAVTTFVLKAGQIGALDAIVAAIAGSGLFEVRAVRYGVRNEERVLDDARRQAVRNARRQAEVYADAAGVKLGEILEMFDGSSQNLGSEAALRLTGPTVQLSPPATIPFRAAITIKWRIVSQR